MILAVAFTALAAGSVRAAASWEEELGASVYSPMKSAFEAVLRHRHRPRGGSESRKLDDEIQRLAKELMKTVRPASESFVASD